MNAAGATAGKGFDLELARDMGELSRDPLKWVYYSFPWGHGDLTGYEGPDRWQREVLTAIRDNLSPQRALRIAVASGHGVGKSALVAWLVLWSLSTCPDARGVVTANTGTQLKTKTWPELAKWYNRFIARRWFELGGTYLMGREKGHEHTWRADAVVWSKNNTEAFAGLHNKGKRITVIFDEASAVDDSVWEVTEGALTDRDTEILWLVFGNPTRNTGSFRECFRKRRDLWRHMKVDSREAAVTNKEQIAQWIADYGEDSDFVKVRVRGDFPEVADNQLIPVDLVRAARERKLTEKDVAYAPKVMGLDIARGGADSSALWLRQGLWARRLFKAQVRDTMLLADRVASALVQHKPEALFLDMGAMGAGVYDRLVQLGFGDAVRGIYFGQSAIREDLYVNRRSEMWHGGLLNWLKSGGALPDRGPEGQDVEDDLIGPEYYYNAKGKLQLESKEEMKARGLPSPDDADALALTFAAPVAPRRSAREELEERAKEREPYDPFTGGEGLDGLFTWGK
jgi:hypothetical protein